MAPKFDSNYMSPTGANFIFGRRSLRDSRKSACCVEELPKLPRTARTRLERHADLAGTVGVLRGGGGGRVEDPRLCRGLSRR